MRKLRLLSLLLLAIAFITVNCTKEGPEGPAGATGAQGPVGVAGATGAAGATGSQGPAGTANVIYSAWINEGPYADSLMASVAIPAANVRRMIVTAPSLSSAILDQGLVISYTRNTLSPGTPILLPWTINLAGTLFQIDSRPTLQKIIYYFYNLNNPGTNPGGSLGASTQFRYIIIPGAVPGGRSTGLGGTNYSAAELKAMSYAQICALFNIPQ